MVARSVFGLVGIAALAALCGCSTKERTAERAPDKPPETSTVVTAGWGPGPGQLGRTSADESSPEGPKSFVVDADGVVHVLDQVNGRIQSFEAGKPAGSVTLPARPFEDIELDAGGFLLLDLYQSPAIVGVGSDGTVAGELPLPSEEIPEPGMVTALSKNETGMWVEVEAEYLVQVGDAHGTPVDPDVVPGQLVDGSAVFRMRVEAGTFTVHRQDGPDATPAKLASIELGHVVRGPSVLGKAGSGLHVMTLLEHAQSDPSKPPLQEHVLVKLSASGDELGRHALPASTGPLEVFRSVRRGADGNFYLMKTSDAGVEIVKVTP